MTALGKSDANSLIPIFEEAGCQIENVCEDSFQIVHPQYPVQTLVYVTEYFVKFSTVVIAVASGWRPQSLSRLNSFLSRSNSKANLVKFIDGREEFGVREEGWNIRASVMLITGAEGYSHDAEALGNVLNIWKQDLAECVLVEDEFTVHLMLKE